MNTPRNDALSKSTDSKLRDASRSAEIAESLRIQSNLNVFYSSSVEGNIGDLLGAPHYSYRFAEAKFVAALKENGIEPFRLKMPEYYGSFDALPSSPCGRDRASVHLIFRSTEQIRLLKFARNVCCFAWEFDVLKDETSVNEHPFLNQKRMLSICDEIWVPCSYTRDVLSRYGLRNTYLLPAPIEVPIRTRTPLFDALAELGHFSVAHLHHNFLMTKQENAEACAELSSTLGIFLAKQVKDHGSVKIYLSILNPEDSRKNIDSMLRAFDYFSRNNSTSVLIVKLLTSTRRFNLFDILGDVVPHKMSSGTAFLSKRIVFFNDYLSHQEMQTLYGISDFYLCASVCEGQNLPLLEAMSQGVVPITTSNTAMTDYITPGNAVVIQGHSVWNDNPNLAGTITGRAFRISLSGVDDIYDALMRSAELSSSRYKRLSEAAIEAVQIRFSSSSVWASMLARFSAIVNSPKPGRSSWISPE